MAKHRPFSQRQLKAISQAARDLTRLPASKRLQAITRARQVVAQHARGGARDEVGAPTVQFYNEVRRILGGQAGNGLARILAQAVAGDAAADFGTEIIRYARGGTLSTLLRGALSRLGPVGNAINWLLGRSSSTGGISESAIADAVKLLTGLGFEVRLPSAPVPTSRGPSFPAPPSAPPTAPPGGGGSRPLSPQPSQPSAGTGGRGNAPPPQPPEDLPMGSFPGNLPIAMELVQSSNVYAYGYDRATLTMRVQFLGSTISRDALTGRGHRGKKRVRGKLGRTVTGTRRGPGPTYDYHGVPERVWQAMRSASSKGGAVWDHLRIRGTIHGHRYDYELVAAARVDVVVPQITPAGLFAGRTVGQVTYVPRRAVGPGQFQSRRIQQGSRQFRSLLPSVGIGARGPRS